MYRPPLHDGDLLSEEGLTHFSAATTHFTGTSGSGSVSSHLSQVGNSNINLSHGSTLALPSVGGGVNSGLNHHPYGAGGSGSGPGGPLHANASMNSNELHALQSVHTHVANNGGGGGGAASIVSLHGNSSTGSGGSAGGNKSGVGHDLDYGFGQGFPSANTGVDGVGDGWNDVLSGVNIKRNARDQHDVMEQYQSPSLSQEERFNMLLNQMKQHDSSDTAAGGGLGLGSGLSSSPSQNNNGRGGHFDPLKWIN